MKVTAIGIIVVLALGAFIASGLLVRQCQTTSEVEVERDTLKVVVKQQKGVIGRLQQNVGTLALRASRKSDSIKLYEKRFEAGKLAEAQFKATIADEISKRRQALARLSNAEVRLGSMQERFNRGEIDDKTLKRYVDTMQVFGSIDEATRAYYGMIQERDVWRDSTGRVLEQLGQLRSTNSDLEKALNKTGETFDDVQTVLSDLRSDVQSKNAAASKGFVRRLFNAGTRRVYHQIDSLVAAQTETLRQRRNQNRDLLYRAPLNNPY